MYWTYLKYSSAVYLIVSVLEYEALRTIECNYEINQDNAREMVPRCPLTCTQFLWGMKRPRSCLFFGCSCKNNFYVMELPGHKRLCVNEYECTGQKLSLHFRRVLHEDNTAHFALFKPNATFKELAAQNLND